jgi:hypothetical protein
MSREPSEERANPVAPAGQLPLTCKEGWADFVLHQSVKVKLLDDKSRRGLTPAQLRKYDRLRVDSHADLGPIHTPQVSENLLGLQLLTDSNRAKQSGARTGAVIDAQGSAGKTTLLKMYGRSYENDLRDIYGWGKTAPLADRYGRNGLGELEKDFADFPDLPDLGLLARAVELEESGEAGGADFIPVAYITLPAMCTPKTLASSMANFYAAPVHSRRPNTEDYVEAAVRAATECATSVILVDDIHFLKLSSSPHQDVNDLLKELANKIAATFIYAGIDCERSGIFTEGKARKDLRMSQTSSRFTPLPILPTDISTPSGREEWQAILRTLETKLRLHGNYDGMLCVDLFEYLHGRSGGVMGTLTELLRRGAALAIRESGGVRSEALTKTLLERIKVDYTAENGPRARSGFQKKAS